MLKNEFSSKFKKTFDNFKNNFDTKNLDYPIYSNGIKYLSGLEAKEFKRLANNFLTFQKKYYNKYPAGSCGNIHNLHMEEIGLIIPKSKAMYLTYGALYKGEKNLYNVTESIELFNKEVLQISGIENNGKTIFNFHVWVTLDSGEIIDLAHYFTISKIKNKIKLLSPIFGNPLSIQKKHNLKYVPYYIGGYITQRTYGNKSKIIKLIS